MLVGGEGKVKTQGWPDFGRLKCSGEEGNGTVNCAEEEKQQQWWQERKKQ